MGYREAVLAHSPVAYYRLGEPSGTTFADSSGNGNTATIAGGVTLGVTGAVRDGNTAASFNGTTGKASTTNGVNSWSGQTALSFDAWVNNPAWAVGHEQVICLGSVGLYLSVENGRPRMSIHTGTQLTNWATGTLLANTWYHIAGTWASGGAVKLYVNGVEVAGDTSTTRTGTLSSSANVHIGAFGGSSLWHSGTIDEAAVYVAQLTAAQIMSHYLVGVIGDKRRVRSHGHGHRH